ncbi:MAG TPA: cyclic nucleotide-binding domain-containing protein, partial [Acetobacteraceae bacterium]
RDYQIDPELAQDTAAVYAGRLKKIEAGLKEDGLDERTRLSIGLVTLTQFEEDRYLRHFKNGIISRAICERLITRVGRLREGARDGGLTGYQRAAGRLLSFTRRLRLALQLQRWMRIDRLLADQLSRRFETLLVTRMVLREMLVFNQRRIAPLLGQPMMRRLAEVLEERLVDTEQALEALKLQFPEYSARLQRQYLGRAALRLEAAQYRQMYADAMISQEVLDDLERDLMRRRQKLDSPPQMDLGLQLETMVAQVPIFSGLSRDRLRGIARLLKPRLAVPGEKLVRRGERGDAMYFISSGTVEVLVPGRAMPIRLSTGEFFGEMALVTRQRRNADVRSVTFCHLLVLHARDFDRLKDQDADLGAHIGSVAKARLAPAAARQP